MQNSSSKHLPVGWRTVPSGPAIGPIMRPCHFAIVTAQSPEANITR